LFNVGSLWTQTVKPNYFSKNDHRRQLSHQLLVCTYKKIDFLHKNKAFNPKSTIKTTNPKSLTMLGSWSNPKEEAGAMKQKERKKEIETFPSLFPSPSSPL